MGSLRVDAVWLATGNRLDISTQALLRAAPSAVGRRLLEGATYWPRWLPCCIVSDSPHAFSGVAANGQARVAERGVRW